jgi:ABC-type multidrug transport system ATPase subunit
MKVAEAEVIGRIVIDRVGKTFGATAALRRVSATIERGEMVMIEGPNGSGKSTLLRILGTILMPSTGSVRYEPLGKASRVVRKQIGWLSHESLAYGDLSGRQNIEIAAGFHGIDMTKAWEEGSERFDLGSFAERPLRTNSRGQRQRVALARALVAQPNLVLLDEPCTGLDQESTDGLLAVLAEERKRGAMVVIVSHDPSLFEPLWASGSPEDSSAPLPVRRIMLKRGGVASVQ